MKKFILRAIKTLVLFAISLNAYSQVYVKGYFKSNGTYVQPHYRSYPNGNPYDNWSTKGNINPYTGKYGTKNIYGYTSNYGDLCNTINKVNVIELSNGTLYSGTNVDRKKIFVSSYEKKGLDDNECLYITNNTGNIVSQFSIRIFYYIGGKAEYSRDFVISSHIPNGNNVLVYINSFDFNNRFYYYYGSEVFKNDFIPYYITYRILSYK